MKRKNDSKKNIMIAFILNLLFSIFELFGGLYTNSISILSDALHDFGDAISILFAYKMEKKSYQKPNEENPFGYSRYSLIGALVTSLILILGGSIMIIQSIKRLINPQPIIYNGVIFMAVIGILLNGYAAYKTYNKDSINQRVVSLHMIEDVLTWVVVLIGAIVMKIWDIAILDPILSILISIIIIFSASKNIFELSHIFLQKTPKNVNLTKFKKKIELLDENIIETHDVYIWSLDGVKNLGSIHVVVKDHLNNDYIILLKRKIKKLANEHKIYDLTVEFDYETEWLNDIKNKKAFLI